MSQTFLQCLDSEYLWGMLGASFPGVEWHLGARARVLLTSATVLHPRRLTLRRLRSQQECDEGQYDIDVALTEIFLMTEVVSDSDDDISWPSWYDPSEWGD